MERLTYEKSPRQWDLGKYPTKYTSRHTFQEVVARLAAYEDTMPLERVQELAQAEKDGRLVVLPCKQGEGDTLWTYCRKYCSKQWPDACSFKLGVSTLNMETVLNTETLGVISASEVGKTVFLTRTEAEAALERQEGGSRMDNHVGWLVSCPVNDGNFKSH